MAVDLEAIRERVKDLELFKSVGDVVDATEAMETSARAPAAYVAIARETAAPNRTQGVHDQKVDAQVAVLFVVAAERKDGGRADAVEALRLPVINSLTAWTPPGARGPLQYVGYRIVRMAQGLIWCECTFATGWALRL